jgi:glycerophosphoryl diester phosphodiesterase
MICRCTLFAWLAVLVLDIHAQDAPATRQLYRIDPGTGEGLQRVFSLESGALPLVSAHRGGAAAGLPENCLATFENTLRHTFALLEVDPRYTKDGKIVLHHDATLDRTTTGRGSVANLDLSELKRLRLKDPEGKVTEYQIPTLDEALEWARGKTVLVLDQKDVPVAARVKKIEEHHAEGYAMLIVYSFRDAKECFALNPRIMMEVMIPTVAKAAEFDETGVPWNSVVAFVGHTPPTEPEIYAAIHQRGARCIVGSSRNLDRRVLTRQVADIRELKEDYQAMLKRGADLIETDVPSQLGSLLFPTAASRVEREFFEVK